MKVQIKLSVKKVILAVIVTALWINISEFILHEIILKNAWLENFSTLGLVYPSELTHALVWVLWSSLFACILVWLLLDCSVLKTTVISWVLGFGLSWLTMWNLALLPHDFLWIALPWSLAEVGIAAIFARMVLAK